VVIAIIAILAHASPALALAEKSRAKALAVSII